MTLFLLNARARHGHVKATSNHPCPAQAAAYDATAFSMADDDDMTARRRSQFATAVAAKQPDGEPLVVAYNTAVVRAVRAIDRERKEEKVKREHEAAVKAQKYAQEAADLREIQTSLSPRAALDAIARRIAALRDEGFPTSIEGIENLRKLRLYKAVAKSRLNGRIAASFATKTKSEPEYPSVASASWLRSACAWRFSSGRCFLSICKRAGVVG